MKKYNKDVWTKSYTLNELQKYRQKLARLANSRIKNINKATSKITGEKYETFGVMELVNDYLKSKNINQFSEKKNITKDKNVLRREIYLLEQMLNAKSGSLRGIIQIEKSRIQTFKDKGIKFADNKEFYDFLSSETFKALSEKFSSEKVVEMFELASEKEDVEVEEVIRALEDFRTKTRVGYKDMVKAINNIDV